MMMIIKMIIIYFFNNVNVKDRGRFPHPTFCFKKEGGEVNPPPCLVKEGFSPSVFTQGGIGTAPQSSTFGREGGRGNLPPLLFGAKRASCF